jgi:hypothetical protein
MADIPSDAELQTLLRLINGTAFPYTLGVRSWEEDTLADQHRLHAACLALESRGLIHRHYEDHTSGTIVWMPVQAPASA